MTEETKPELIETAIIYIGKRLGNDNKLSNAFILVNIKDKINDYEWDVLERTASHFNSKKNTRLIVGGIYKANAKIEGKRIDMLSLSSLKFDRLCGDASFVSRMDAIDTSNRIRWKSNNQQAKLAAEHPIELDLQRLRSHYHKLPYSDRVAFELTVLHYIRKLK